MSTEDIGQIIDRLDRIEGKQDKQGEQIADLRVSLAGICTESKVSTETKGFEVSKLAAWGALIAALAACVGLFIKGGK